MTRWDDRFSIEDAMNDMHTDDTDDTPDLAKRVEELTAENATLKKHDAELTEWNKKLHAQNEEFRTLLAKSADQLAVWSKLAGALEGEPR